MINAGVSVIICTYNGTARLAETLKYLATQECTCNVELVVVDNNSTDGTSEFAFRTWQSFGAPFEIRIFKEVNPGKAYALESGYDAAIYEYMITCDDDNWLSKDFVQKAYQLMEKFPEAGLLGSKTIGVFETPNPKWFDIVSNHYAVGNQFDSEGFFEMEKDYVWGAGMVFRKSIWTFLRCESFEFVTGKNVKKAVGEDAELSIIVKGLGYRFYYSEELIVHHWMPKGRITWDNCLGMFRGFGSTTAYIDLYKMLFKSFSSGREVKNYKLKKSLYHLYQLCRVVVTSGFMPWRPSRETVGNVTKLKYVKRFSYLKEVIFSGDFERKRKQTETFLKRILEHGDIRKNGVQRTDK